MPAGRKEGRMPEYWFVVNPTNEPLYEALCSVLTGRPGFHIIKDRRFHDGEPPPDGERRLAQIWRTDDISIAEREDSQASNSASGRQ
jgi:hypothetical protein